jgi:D-alanine-D-alanine ligase
VSSISTSFNAAKSLRTPSQRKLAITVLAGGPGGEREVSLESGKAVAEALKSLGHDVSCGDVGPDNLGALARQVDCVFVALHGRFGEDGQIQEILERRGLCYVGSGPQACALAMDKARAKARFTELGIPTPRYAVAEPKNIREALAAWSLPVVVKPVREGSSLNCSIVREYEQFRPTVEKVIGEYGDCLVEEYVPGKEVTVAILGDRALPPIEIRTKREFYNYQAKYVDEDTEYDFNIDLPPAMLENIAQMNLRVHEGLGCRDFSRVDWRVDERGMKPYALELNVIPGLTSHSLLPKAAAQSGVNMPQMCQFVVDLAMRRGIKK